MMQWKAKELGNKTKAKEVVAKPVAVVVYFESLCPDSERFITVRLYPAYRALLGKNIFKLTLIPYGNAKVGFAKDIWSSFILYSILATVHSMQSSRLRYPSSFSGVLPSQSAEYGIFGQDLQCARADCLVCQCAQATILVCWCAPRNLIWVGSYSRNKISFVILFQLISQANYPTIYIRQFFYYFSHQTILVYRHMIAIGRDGKSIFYPHSKSLQFTKAGLKG